MFKVLSAVAFAALLLASCETKTTAEKGVSASASISSDGAGNVSMTVNGVNVSSDINTSVSQTSNVTNTVETNVVVRNAYKKSKNVNGLSRQLEANGKFQIVAGEIKDAEEGMELTIKEEKDGYVISANFVEENGEMVRKDFSDSSDIIKNKYKGDFSAWQKAFMKAFEADMSAPNQPEMPEMPNN
jgi:hypothetical protein